MLKSRTLWIEILIVAALYSAMGVWAARFANRWMAQGGRPSFYQQYFEPAVMIACGRGFVVTEGQRPQSLEDFLQLRRDQLECRDVSTLKVGRRQLYQQAWIYLLHTVGWWWRAAGVSWSGMGPLYGGLFGLTMAMAYAIFRLGMGRVVAVLWTLGLAVSTAQLLNLPHLRDYSKAPFTLALVFILGLLVTTAVRWWTVLALSAAYGVVLGIGYGFRTDFLATLPVVVITLFLFLDGGLTRNLKLKAASTLLFLASFLVVSWPVSSQVYEKGGCQWHVALLGLQTPFDEYLHIGSAPYDFGYAYSDGYVAQTIYGYSRRTHDETTPPEFCSHKYDVVSGRYLRDIVLTFPADVVTRAYASVLQIVELPFLRWDAPMPGWHPSLYQAREEFFRPKIGWGAVIAGIALLMASAASLRLGLFLLFFLAYFGGYPAIQFQERHHFHLEFITWWAFGFIVHQTITAVWSLRGEHHDVRRPFSLGLVRATAMAIGGIALTVAALVVARHYQAREAVRLFNAYIAAPKTQMALSDGGAFPDPPFAAFPQYVEVDLDEAACGPKPSITFKYDPALMNSDLSRTVIVARRARAAGTTRVFLAVYEHFKGLDFSSATPGCVTRVARFDDVKPFRLLLGATLPPEWETLPLHQRLLDWEGDPLSPPLVDLPALSTWKPTGSLRGRMTFFGALTVDGDGTRDGYQLTSPRVAAPVGAEVLVRIDLAQLQGRVCLGALNGTTEGWLIPASALRQELKFTVDRTGGFYVTVANCNVAADPPPSRFNISRARYAVQ